MCITIPMQQIGRKVLTKLNLLQGLLCYPNPRPLSFYWTKKDYNNSLVPPLYLAWEAKANLQMSVPIICRGFLPRFVDEQKPHLKKENNIFFLNNFVVKLLFKSL